MSCEHVEREKEIKLLWTKTCYLRLQPATCDVAFSFKMIAFLSMIFAFLVYAFLRANKYNQI